MAEEDEESKSGTSILDVGSGGRGCLGGDVRGRQKCQVEGPSTYNSLQRRSVNNAPNQVAYRRV